MGLGVESSDCEDLWVISPVRTAQMGGGLKICWKDFELLDQTLQEMGPIPRQGNKFFLSQVFFSVCFVFLWLLFRKQRVLINIAVQGGFS